MSRASKKLVSDEGLLPELGPTRLDHELQKYIWNGRTHLNLKDLWEYLNRYTYLPRLRNQSVLTKAVQAAISGMLPGPFAYAERWEEATDTYHGLAIEKAAGIPVVVDRDSVIVKPDVALAHAPKPKEADAASTAGAQTSSSDVQNAQTKSPTGSQDGEQALAERLPTRFQGTVMISSERPARDIHQIVEAIVEQLTTLPGCDVSLRLEIDADVPAGLDRAKVRTLLENAATLGFIDKAVS